MAQQPSRDDVLTISVTGYHEEPGPESGPGEGLVLESTRGDIHCLIHPAPESTELAVVWVVGARGGFRGPADGNLYAPLAEQFRGQGIVSLRPSYRQPNHLDECVLDALAAVSLLRQGLNVRRVAIVGHSFGGAVAISAARYSDTICAVASLSGQTYGAKDAVLVAPRPCSSSTARTTPSSPSKVPISSTLGPSSPRRRSSTQGPDTASASAAMTSTAS